MQAVLGCSLVLSHPAVEIHFSDPSHEALERTHVGTRMLKVRGLAVGGRGQGYVETRAVSDVFSLSSLLKVLVQRCLLRGLLSYNRQTSVKGVLSGD